MFFFLLTFVRKRITITGGHRKVNSDALGRWKKSNNFFFFCEDGGGITLAINWRHNILYVPIIGIIFIFIIFRFGRTSVSVVKFVTRSYKTCSTINQQKRAGYKN